MITQICRYRLPTDNENYRQLRHRLKELLSLAVCCHYTVLLLNFSDLLQMLMYVRFSLRPIRTFVVYAIDLFSKMLNTDSM